MLQRQEMRNATISFNTKRHSVFPVLETLRERKNPIFKMLCTFETLIHRAESQWHLNKDPNCSPLGPLWKLRSLHLQMPQSLATPASTSVSQGEEKQKSLPSSGAFAWPGHGYSLEVLGFQWSFSILGLRSRSQVTQSNASFPCSGSAACQRECFQVTPMLCNASHQTVSFKLVLCICTLLVGCFKFKLTFCPTHVACGLL